MTNFAILITQAITQRGRGEGCVGMSIRLADSGLGACNLTACVSALDGGQVAQCALDAAITAVGGSRLRILQTGRNML